MPCGLVCCLQELEAALKVATTVHIPVSVLRDEPKNSKQETAARLSEVLLPWYATPCAPHNRLSHELLPLQVLALQGQLQVRSTARTGPPPASLDSPMYVRRLCRKQVLSGNGRCTQRWRSCALRKRS
jgi:hypothetical protein